MPGDKETIRKSRRLRVFVAVLLGVGAFVGADVVLTYLQITKVRGNQRRVRKVIGSRVLRWYNDENLKNAGHRHSPFALLTHVGRRSGQTHQTALGATAYGDGFVMPLVWGRQCDWCQNVMAAGKATLAWQGHTYELDRPEIVSAPELARVWPAWKQMALQAGRCRDYLWLHQKQGAAEESEQVESPAQGEAVPAGS